MATTANEWHQSAESSNQKRPEPVITFDHMSDSENPHYFYPENKSRTLTNSQLLIDSLLIAGMLIALIMLSL